MNHATAVKSTSTLEAKNGHLFIFRISEVRVEQRDLENIVVNHIFQFFAKKKSRFQVSQRDIY